MRAAPTRHLPEGEQGGRTAPALLDLSDRIVLDSIAAAKKTKVAVHRLVKRKHLDTPLPIGVEERRENVLLKDGQQTLGRRARQNANERVGRPIRLRTVTDER